MAHNVEPALDATSCTPDSSPSDIIGDTKIRRPLVKIPSAQKDLLNLHQSWASFLSQRSTGFINVPPQVLDQLKASYTRRKQTKELDKAAATTSDAEGDTGVPEPSGSQSSTPAHVERSGDDGDDGDNDDDGPGKPIGWTPSPESHLRPPRFESQEPSELFITQIPEESPLKPTIPTSPTEQFKLAPFPQSSQGPDDELEVEVPAALAYDIESINKSALPILATPPSAQVVPCTFEQSMQGVSTSASTRLESELKPRSRKHIYNRVPELYRGPKPGVLSSHLNTNVDLVGVASALGKNTDIEGSLSINNMSSSIIPSTREEHSTKGKKQPTAWDIPPDQISMCNTSLSSEIHHTPSASRQYSPVQIRTSPSYAIRSPQSVTHSPSQPILASKSWEAPFAHYLATYPSYAGTIQDFLTACIYIKLQHRRIRTSLYDDFIRAWVEGYLSYVKDCDDAKPPRKALRAIEWYNEIDDDPLFTSRVVTRQNLQSILNFYPNELDVARQALGMSSSQGLSEASVPSSQAGPLNQVLTHTQSRGKDPIRSSVEAAGGGVRMSRLSPVLKPKAPTIAIDKRIPAHKSFGGIESRPVQREALTRSFSESTTHKRVATNDLRSEGTKRISLGLDPGAHNRIWSDSGSTASNHSERSKNATRNSLAGDSTARQRNAKTDEDPEERRRRRLAKHFKKQMAGRESIASSAPISTPTSGRK
ncbi:hypothetical protein FHL15_009462 [Xylaria flabelliformis]|uniref:Uncharacterized protein n=1 Tax=Xylaria flabelliformis TaxID=2512241 RepID=A0A553HP24_9PEZI|nr:hypothetical protein FHL15_009462 [Xylaria flabelliformis]